MNQVTRRAVLIGAPGKEPHFLRGVQHDLRNLKRFLQSERGGSFFAEEIIILTNPSFGDIIAAIFGSSVDYLFVYFSGHGCTRNGNQRMIALDGYERRDIDLLNRECPRQLVIVDACRDFVREGPGAIGGLGDRFDSFTGSATRELFDEWILHSPRGHVILHATAPGKSACDTNRGGVFTRAWLDNANHFIPEPGYDYAPVYLPLLLQQTVYSLEAKEEEQRPEIVFHEGDFLVPFAVAKHEERLIYEDADITSSPNPPANNDLGLLLVIVGVGLLAFLGESES
ncbi:MAG: caspase family protein [Bacteroidetes bacterium]|nr:caspase family protein [Bacteroidota bacterium]